MEKRHKEELRFQSLLYLQCFKQYWSNKCLQSQARKRTLGSKPAGHPDQQKMFDVKTLDRCSGAWSEQQEVKLMDDQQEKDSVTPEPSAILINGVNENASDDLENNVKCLTAADPEVTFPALSIAQKETAACHRVLNPLTSKESCLLSPPSPLRLSDIPEHASSDSSANAISLTSCVTKGLSSWSLPTDCEKAPFTIMEPGAISSLTGDCLMQQSRTCLGCFIEAKDGIDAEPGLSLKVGDVNRDYDACSVSDIGIHCMSTGETMRYGDQLLSDQLLSFPIHKSRAADKRDAEKSDSDSEDPTPKNYYEGLLLDKCNGDDGLLANPNQEWGYFESFISESKIELLDLCSKNELSVNLFSEEDVDNYMFDDDDSTLGSDVCSLKIRYESFQDSVREKTTALQEEAQFNFFPNVFSSCTKKENKSAIKRTSDPAQFKTEEVVGGLWDGVEEEDKSALSKNCNSTDVVQYISAKRNHFLDSVNSTEDSGEFSDDSTCTESSYDALREIKDCTSYLSKEHPSSFIQQNYGLRAKRKVRYNEDYLYDVDSIESEKLPEKKEGVPDGLPKKEDDDDWCPKKRRKASRKEPPVVIKYIIVNRFKGEKHMLVKLGKIDADEPSVTLSKDLLDKYDKLAPLKGYWQDRRQSRLEFLKASMCEGQNMYMNGSDGTLIPRKRKSKLANRHRLQRIQAVEQAVSPHGPSGYEQKHGCSSKDVAGLGGIHTLTTAASSCENGLYLSHVPGPASMKCRSLMRECMGVGKKVLRRIKFRSEARLKCRKMKAEEDKEKADLDAVVISPLLESDEPVPAIKEEFDCAPENTSPSECHKGNDAANPVALPAAACPLDKPVASADISTNVAVIPGGYLQTLLDASDSSQTAATYFNHHPPGHQSAGVVQPENDFHSLQLAQSCVLSPPSESELQQSPHHLEMEAGFGNIWHSKPVSNQPEFIPNLRDPSLLISEFGVPAENPTAGHIHASGFNEMLVSNSKRVYLKKYVQENHLQPEDAYQTTCNFNNGDSRFNFQRGTVTTDNGRLISFDSVGSLSVSSSNYSSLSLKSCEKDGDDDINDDFLAHCSPKLVIQQSIDEITPLKESSDLLDISNFTPDKFRHSSLSEMSPPDTPNLSPQITASDIKPMGNLKSFHESFQGALNNEKVKWNCTGLQPQETSDNGFELDNHQFQFHMFNDEDPVSLLEKDAGLATFHEQASQLGKGAKPKKKSAAGKNNNQSTTQKNSKKKTPKANKATDKTPSKSSKQSSKSPKKGKNANLVNGDQSLMIGSPGSLHNMVSKKAVGDGIQHCGPTSLKIGTHDSEWHLGKEGNTGWSEPRLGNSNILLDDDQREFEEPSNILSNIASGMADVQRFMMASIEPLWGPIGHNSVPDIFRSPESNSLKLKTLKILAGTHQESKKKVNSNSLGSAKNHKATTKGSHKNMKLAAYDPSRPNCSTVYSTDIHSTFFDKNFCNLSTLGNNAPTHKKLYRHKSTSKTMREENCKVKRPERDPVHKNSTVTASFEKLR
ncbi:neurite extension and migration factor isoform X1 [Pleurodeles waltl]|uniref:neurite extension and migration factor isoform X1 n=2 Tax=Pleurodeles waltl TaxID=8319 RepID=UPI0037094734